MMKMNVTVFCVVFTLITVFKWDNLGVMAEKSKCDTCNAIVNNFEKGLKKTAKSNYGGGNTKWEESRLGSFATSETRFVEVMEGLCEGEDKNCPTILEENEELIEKYWFSFYAKGSEEDMKMWLCVSNMKVCCPENTFGPTCLECPGGKIRPCKDNGNCEGGGTRKGTGKCNCNTGYEGDLCDSCKDGYFEASKNDTHTTCTACHRSCQSTCWEEGPKGCDDCKTGYTQTEEDGCQDIDECSAEASPCDNGKYCSNTEGSYYCNSCHKSCDGCTTFGADKCTECNEGYRLEEDRCTDINECTEEGGAELCTGEHRSCVNQEGSFSCDCDSGYIEEEDQCIIKPPEPPKPKQSTPSTTEEDSASENVEKDEL
ncbi:cysteine-rich with EGF-like domain protein 2 isoform X1 [Mizuhopecten yessoensis]|uniref:cysteine-rich with EGF-like domain protein 2 isoform X1 n=1 Tax=Mizuhopecten yessoensis TaxID=6573 RepID=UPI000B45C4EA|nr:cysteine-rich with EGF-like domain protein 2 isoform X1 [Mizuhopecten yessoensis]XP_021369295.1 cysteine-rich with EGF-like domain protein 2 isoform X1 [Mizuhopecten yessoensis]